MSSYQERLDDFVRDCTFVQFRHPMRNRDGAWCDACGSGQPGLLYGLRDEGSGRCFFVGGNCLQGLTERGAIGRRTRASAEAAYAREAECRREDQHRSDVRRPAKVDAPSGSEAAPLTAAIGIAGAVAVVAVLHPTEWASIVQAVQPDPERWLVIPLGDALTGFSDLQ